MAVRSSNFEIAADDAASRPDVQHENVVEMVHGQGRFSLWRRPSTGQYAMFQLRMSRSSGSEQNRAIDRFFTTLVLTPEEVVAEGREDADGVPYADRVEAGETAVGMEWFWEMIERDVIGMDMLVDIFREVMEIASAFPTSSESGSSSGRRKSGPPSTAGSRRVGSTRSRSDSAAS